RASRSSEWRQTIRDWGVAHVSCCARMRIWHDCLAEAHSRNNKKRLTDTEAGPARTGRNPKRPRWRSIPCPAGANDATDTLGGGRADESECPAPWWEEQKH